jgi:G3E family GTPase
VVNEFGDLGIDASLLRPGQYQTFEINKGSLFCICTKTDLIAAFSEIANRLDADLVLVEATGLAEPRDLNVILDLPSLSEQFEVAANVCVVDPTVFPKIACTLQSARAQVRQADLVLLNKTDLADEQELGAVEQQIHEINPDARILRTEKCSAGVDVLLAARQGTGACSLDAPPTEPPRNVASIAYDGPWPLRRQAFYNQLSDWGERVLRGKGVVRFPDGDVFVEVVNGVVSSRPANGLRVATGSGAGFVLIARGVNAEQVREQLAACTATPT